VAAHCQQLPIVLLAQKWPQLAGQRKNEEKKESGFTCPLQRASKHNWVPPNQGPQIQHAQPTPASPAFSSSNSCLCPGSGQTPTPRLRNPQGSLPSGDPHNGEQPPAPQPQQLPAPSSSHLGWLGRTGRPQSPGNRPHLNFSRGCNTPCTRESHGSLSNQSCEAQRHKHRVGSPQGHGTALPC